MIMGAKVVNGG